MKLTQSKSIFSVYKYKKIHENGYHAPILELLIQKIKHKQKQRAITSDEYKVLLNYFRIKGSTAHFSTLHFSTEVFYLKLYKLDQLKTFNYRIHKKVEIK